MQNPRRRVDADVLACHAPTPCSTGRPAGVGCPVGQDHVALALALAGLAIDLGAMVADISRLGVGLRQPAAVLTASEPLQHLSLPEP